MNDSFRSTDEIVAQCSRDNKDVHLNLSQMKLFASGYSSNVYSGVAKTDSSHEMNIVIKKIWKSCWFRELEILRSLGKFQHKNVAQLLYSYTKEHEARVCLSLIFEYEPQNLYQFLKENNRRLDILEVKLITWQLFRGQYHIQKSNICHRDIKPQNLLYNADTGHLKICDFGFAQILSATTPLGSGVVTRYYRPPELLLGSEFKFYSCNVDVWSCGCVFAELLKGRVFLAGNSTTNQAELIFDALGCPTEEDLTAMQVNNTTYQEIKTGYKPDPARRTLHFSFMYEQSDNTQMDRRTFVHNNKINEREMRESVDLLRQILVYNPERRLSGINLLTHEYFDDLFFSNSMRSNGRVLCLTLEDFQAVETGDETVSQESTV